MTADQPLGSSRRARLLCGGRRRITRAIPLSRNRYALLLRLWDRTYSADRRRRVYNIGWWLRYRRAYSFEAGSDQTPPRLASCLRGERKRDPVGPVEYYPATFNGDITRFRLRLHEIHSEFKGLRRQAADRARRRFWPSQAHTGRWLVLAQCLRTQRDDFRTKKIALGGSPACIAIRFRARCLPAARGGASRRVPTAASWLSGRGGRALAFDGIRLRVA
ncbi:hypothetical protein SAMN05192583_1046 [Sphingomonas gellani]|uniref:Uncharacterized protein n=1 Tax=Sphingomonas gellani TaxID=1166340 RepID=A0A1H8ASQ6_9SPHN|nr:hypothetical protein SAMN05192583_1046 [Sphingomonas gellani]